MRESISAQTISFIAQKINRNPAEIHEGSNFYTDLGITSVTAMELICDLEDKFHFEIPDEYLGKLHKVRDVIDFIEKKFGAG